MGIRGARGKPGRHPRAFLLPCRPAASPRADRPVPLSAVASGPVPVRDRCGDQGG